MKLILKLLFFALLSTVSADVFAQSGDSKPAVALQRWADSISQEKVYLHMDKPYYALGDTIWFKGYLTTGSRHQLSARSGAVYVDLINEKDQPVRMLKLPVDSGTVAGNFILDEDIKQGSYTIRAYSQWMRNAGENYFFYKTFIVGDPNAKIPAATAANKKVINATLQQTDIQLFPESGNLVNGLTSRVGFKALGPDGLGQAISGTITDSQNKVVSQFSTLHAGIGSFMLKPIAGKTYTANIKFTDGSTKTTELPAALNEGYVLSVYQAIKNAVTVRIQASAALQNTTVNLIVHSGGELIFSEPIQLNKTVTTVSLEKGTFPSGIAQYTLFNANNEPLNERIAFIKNNDHMQLGVRTPKVIYKRKEQVQLELNARQSGGMPTAANFSVAVIDESKVPVDEDAESTIFSNILLSSDLKGYIEKPNYYFMADTGNVDKALDNLMLTQGYRRFEWKPLLDTASIKPVFAAEKLGITISGNVKNLQHKNADKAVVMLVSLNGRINKTTVSDAKGRFKFDNLVFADSAKFAVQARTEGNKESIISIDSILAPGISIKQNLAEVNIIKATLKKAEQEGKPIKLTGRVLKQVDIKAKKIIKDENVMAQGMFSPPSDESADRVIRPDPAMHANVMLFIRDNLTGVIWKPDGSIQSTRFADGVIEVLVNGGAGYGGGAIEDIPIEDVIKVQIIKNNEAIKARLRRGDSYPAGFVNIITKVPSARKQYNPGIANIQPKGFNKVRQFYAPRYDKPDDIAAKLPDPRTTTIFWDPYVNTDMTGRTTLDFFNADGPGNYRVVIEGISADGELGRQVYRYKVEQ
jgi:hypothetical protein